MLRLLRQLYALGINGNQNTYEVCKIRIVNRLTMLCFFKDFALICLNLTIGNYQGVWVDLAALAFFWCQFCVQIKKKNLIKHSTCTCFCLNIILPQQWGMHAISEARANEVENFLIPGAIAIIILLEGFGQKVQFTIGYMD